MTKLTDAQAGVEGMYAMIQSIKCDGTPVQLDDLDMDDVEEIAELIAPMYSRKN